MESPQIRGDPFRRPVRHREWPSEKRCLQCSQRLRERARARHLEPKVGQASVQLRRRNKAGKNVATKIAKESLRALVRTSVDGRRQSRRRRLLRGATREVNHRRSTERGRRGRCGRHWCCNGFSTDMNCRRYCWSESCRRHGRRGSRTGHCKDQIDADWHCQHVRCAQQQDPQNGGCAG